MSYGTSPYANPALMGQFSPWGQQMAPINLDAYAGAAMGSSDFNWGGTGDQSAALAATFGDQALTAQPAGTGFSLGGIGKWLGNGQNMGTVVQGISALTGAYLGYQQLKQAKEALGLQREAFNANLNNSIQTYNTSLEDRIRGRTSAYEGKEGDVQAYLARHSLKR